MCLTLVYNTCNWVYQWSGSGLIPGTPGSWLSGLVVPTSASGLPALGLRTRVALGRTQQWTTDRPLGTLRPYNLAPLSCPCRPSCSSASACLTSSIVSNGTPAAERHAQPVRYVPGNRAVVSVLTSGCRFHIPDREGGPHVPHRALAPWRQRHGRRVVWLHHTCESDRSVCLHGLHHCQ